MRTAGRQRTPGNLGDALGLGGGRLRSGQGSGLLRASDVRPESWALERRPPASKEWPFPQQPPSPAACEAWGFLDGLTEGVEQVLSHPSERWPRAGPGPPWETRVMGTAESSQPTRRRWGHRELLRDAAWNPGLTDAVRKSRTRDLSLRVGEGGVGPAT